MTKSNILLEMTMEKNRKIREVISIFLGHEPSLEEKKLFNIMHSLGESNIYFRGKFIGRINYPTDEGFVM